MIVVVVVSLTQIFFLKTHIAKTNSLNQKYTYQNYTETRYNYTKE